MTDSELMDRVQAGDKRAFDELFSRHAPRVRARMTRMVQDWEAMEDIVQEVFFRAWTKADTYCGRGTVAGWLHRIAFNLALNHIRSSRRAREVRFQTPEPDESDDDGLNTLARRDLRDTSPGPQAQLEQSELRSLVEDLVRRLPESKRDVVRLVFEREMTVEQAASALGIAPGTAKSRLFYGRKAMEQRLQDYLCD